ncbi:MAG: 3'-5' exonuclease, partial [bacterium]
MRKEEEEEQAYLDQLFKKVNRTLAQIDETMQSKKQDIDNMNNHMQEHKRDMDHLQKNALRETIYNYKVLNTLFPCKKTILGDINQSVNPFSSSNINSIRSVFSNATCMTILKSYRSTYEMTTFTKKINKGIEIEPLERHGEEPEVTPLKNTEEEIKYIKSLIKDFNERGANSLGIICKTQIQADKLFEELRGEGRINLLNAISVASGNGIVITTAHLAKGLEFDHVIGPFCSDKNYQTEPDKQMLYVACTRAMHKLNLTY